MEVARKFLLSDTPLNTEKTCIAHRGNVEKNQITFAFACIFRAILQQFLKYPLVFKFFEVTSLFHITTLMMTNAQKPINWLGSQKTSLFQKLLIPQKIPGFFFREEEAKVLNFDTKPTRVEFRFKRVEPLIKGIKSFEAPLTYQWQHMSPMPTKSNLSNCTI